MVRSMHAFMVLILGATFPMSRSYALSPGLIISVAASVETEFRSPSAKKLPSMGAAGLAACGLEPASASRSYECDADGCLGSPAKSTGECTVCHTFFHSACIRWGLVQYSTVCTVAFLVHPQSSAESPQSSRRYKHRVLAPIARLLLLPTRGPTSLKQISRRIRLPPLPPPRNCPPDLHQRRCLQRCQQHRQRHCTATSATVASGS